MSNFEFCPHINRIPSPDEPMYTVRWHPDGRTPFRAWVRGNTIYLLELDWRGEPCYSKHKITSYVAHTKLDGETWVYYDNDSTYRYYPILQTTDNPTMVEDMEKILAEHQLTIAIEKAINQNRN